MDGRNRCPASRTQARAVVVRRVDIATVAPDDDAVDQHQSSSDRSMPVLGGHCNFRLGRGSLLSGSLTRWRDLFRFRCSWSSIRRHSPTVTIGYNHLAYKIHSIRTCLQCSHYSTPTS